MLEGTPRLDNGSEAGAARPPAPGVARSGGARMTLPPDPEPPAAPPPEVRDAVERVTKSLDELAERRLSLRLAIGEDARLRLQVRQGESVVREISAAHALELLETDVSGLAGGES